MAPAWQKKNGQLDIVIVGGSLASLQIALSLLQHSQGYQDKPTPRITILERSTHLLHSQGAGIVAGGPLQTFFNTYDRTRTPIAVTSPFRQYLDREGAQVKRQDYEQRMTSWELVFWVLRANVEGVGAGYVNVEKMGLIEEGQGKAVYRNGCHVKGVGEAADGDGRVEVVFTNAEGEEETLQTDLVIAADGPSSSVRQIFCPEVERTYAGYCAWRGTVPESELSAFAYDTLVERFTFFHDEGTQVLCYVIPGEKGTLERGKRLVNWVWYRNAVGEGEKDRFLMDADGAVHRNTLPVGKAHPDVWDETKRVAQQMLPPQFAELVQRTKEPFCQAVTDVLSPGCVFMDGKVLLVGDAVAGFRPHTAASTSQAAFHAMEFAKVMKGELELGEWEQGLMQYARETQRSGIAMGERSQFGRHPLAR